LSLQTIEEQLIKGISVIISRDESAITPDTLFNKLGIDSLGFVEVLVFIEKTFNLRLIELNMTRKDFESIHSIASFIHNRM
jgi:acyl carrier protein